MEKSGIFGLRIVMSVELRTAAHDRPGCDFVISALVINSSQTTIHYQMGDIILICFRLSGLVW